MPASEPKYTTGHQERPSRKSIAVAIPGTGEMAMREGSAAVKTQEEPAIAVKKRNGVRKRPFSRLALLKYRFTDEYCSGMRRV
jgi:hypothetical protein